MSSTQRKIPRTLRLGGFCLSHDVAVEWASKLKGKKLDPLRNMPTVRKTILDKVKGYDVLFRLVGEDVYPTPEWMIVTQSASFKGYKGMNTDSIPKFEEGEKEAISRMLLDAEGLVFSVYPRYLVDEGSRHHIRVYHCT